MLIKIRYASVVIFKSMLFFVFTWEINNEMFVYNIWLS